MSLFLLQTQDEMIGLTIDQGKTATSLRLLTVTDIQTYQDYLLEVEEVWHAVNDACTHRWLPRSKFSMDKFLDHKVALLSQMTILLHKLERSQSAILVNTWLTLKRSTLTQESDFQIKLSQKSVIRTTLKSPVSGSLSFKVDLTDPYPNPYYSHVRRTHRPLLEPA